MNPEHRAKISATKRGVKLSLEHRASISAAVKKRWEAGMPPEHKAKIAAGCKKRWEADKFGELRAKISAAMRGVKRKPPTPETRAKFSAIMRRRWEEARAKGLKYLKPDQIWPGNRSPRSPETRRKMSEAKKGRAVSPETRAKLSAIMRRRWEEARAKLADADRRVGPGAGGAGGKAQESRPVMRRAGAPAAKRDLALARLRILARKAEGWPDYAITNDVLLAYPRARVYLDRFLHHPYRGITDAIKGVELTAEELKKEPR